MSLTFPNPSRCFDPKRRIIQFWGHDNTNEVSFFLEVAALSKLVPEHRRDEPGFLQAFDTALHQIQEAARTLYLYDRNRSDVLVLSERQF